MHFSTDADPTEIPVYLTRFISITGWIPWKRRLAWLQEQVRVNPTMPHFLNERFGRELAFEQVWRHQKRTGRYPWPPETDEQQRLYSLLAMVARCHQRLSQAGKMRLKGMIEDALKSDHGFAPLAFEMKIVAQLMTRGFDVIFHDMEEGGGFDFLVARDGVEMEVECKFVSGDIGRQIHLKKMHLLGTVLFPNLEGFLNQKEGGYLVRILIPGRLAGNNKQHQELRGLLLHAFAGQELSANPNGYEVSITEFSIEDSPFGRMSPATISPDHIQRFLVDELKIDEKNVLIHISPRKGAILVTVESVKRDAVLKGIHHQLKGAARNQLSGARPGILCCELGDLSEDQLLALANDQSGGTGLQYMVSNLMARRPQIHTLAFTTPGTVRIKKTMSGTSMDTSAQETGPTYTFRNPSHPLSDDPRCSVF